MSAHYDPDPPHNWRRKNYDEAPLAGLNFKDKMDLRKGSEIETNRDLDKPLEQLVCDVHEETHDGNRTELANIAGAQKRLVSMMARVAKSNDRMACRMLFLNVIMLIMMAITVYFTYVVAKNGG